VFAGIPALSPSEKPCQWQRWIDGLQVTGMICGRGSVCIAADGATALVSGTFGGIVGIEAARETKRIEAAANCILFPLAEMRWTFSTLG